MVLLAAPGTGSVAFVASRKIGRAVERNRARRILRSAWRELAPQGLEDHDIAFVARQTIRGAKTHELMAEMTDLLQRARVTS